MIVNNRPQSLSKQNDHKQTNVSTKHCISEHSDDRKQPSKLHSVLVKPVNSGVFPVNTAFANKLWFSCDSLLNSIYRSGGWLAELNEHISLVYS